MATPGRPSPRARAAALLLATLLAAAAASVPAGAGAGITSSFAAPAASKPLSHEEALQLLAGSQHAGRALAEVQVEDPVEQVHIGLGGPGEAVVTFASWRRGVSSKVLYGPAGGSLSHEAVGQASTYVTHICPTSSAARRPRMSTNGGVPDITDEALANLVNTSRLGLPPSSLSYRYIAEAAEAWDVLEQNKECIKYKNPLGYHESPYIHTAVLTGLLPRAMYSYRPQAGSRTFNFTMPPQAGASDPAKPLKLGVWADVGITNVSFAVMKSLARMEPDAVLLAGDYSYADGWTPKWETFGVMMEPLMSRFASLGVPGNHEMVSGNSQAVDWLYRYPQPFRQSGSESAFFYSYEMGLVHILALAGNYAPTDNATSARPSAQYLFAQEDLARVDRERTPWIVVMFHTPWYHSNEHHYQEGMKHQWDMEELLFEHGVDLVISGHVHAYERSRPVYKYGLNPCGAVHVVIGDAGNTEGPALPWKEPQPEWSAFREASFGSGALTVHNRTHASWEWQRVACASKPEGQPYYSWDGHAGLDGAGCSTDGDTSRNRFAALDSTVLVRDTAACPSRASGRRLGSDIHV